MHFNGGGFEPNPDQPNQPQPATPGAGPCYFLETKQVVRVMPCMGFNACIKAIPGWRNHGQPLQCCSLSSLITPPGPRLLLHNSGSQKFTNSVANVGWLVERRPLRRMRMPRTAMTSDANVTMKAQNIYNHGVDALKRSLHPFTTTSMRYRSRWHSLHVQCLSISGTPQCPPIPTYTQGGFDEIKQAKSVMRHL